MINDYKQTRECYCGHGTLSFSRDITNTKEVIFESSYIEVGKKNNEFNGKNIKEQDRKSVVLNFDGENALKSINILIEDLKRIKKEIKKKENKSKFWKFFLPIIIIVVGTFLTGCTSAQISPRLEGCVLEEGIIKEEDLQVTVLCIEGVKYLKVGTGLSPYLEGDGSTLPYIKECECE